MTDVRRVAFVTDRFLELQGLAPAAVGAGLLFSLLVYQSVAVPGRLSVATQAAVLGMIAGNQAMLYLQASYRRTFGDAVATRGQKALATVPALLPWVGVLIDMQAEFNGRSGPSAAGIALGSYSLWVVLKDWPWRTHHLAGAAAGIGAAVVTAAVPAAPDALGIDPARSNAFFLAYNLVGVGLVASALGDHLLLTRWLRPSPDTTAKPGALGWSGFRRAWVAVCVVSASAVTLGLSDSYLPMFPSLLMVALLVGATIPAFVDAVRAIRAFGKRPLVVADKGSLLRLGPTDLVAAMAVAFSAVVHAVLLAPGRPTLLAVSIVAASALLAIRPQARRAHFARAIAVAAALAVFPILSPARAVVALVGALAAAIAIDGLLEVRRPASTEVNRVRA